MNATSSGRLARKWESPKSAKQMQQENFMISPKLMLPVTLSLTILGACSTTPIMQGQQGHAGSPIKAVPCTETAVIRFHAPDNAPDAAAWQAGVLPDPANGLDTPSTVAALRRANAARNAVCGP